MSFDFEEAVSTVRSGDRVRIVIETEVKYKTSDRAGLVTNMNLFNNKSGIVSIEKMEPVYENFKIGDRVKHLTGSEYIVGWKGVLHVESGIWYPQQEEWMAEYLTTEFYEKVNND